MLTETQRKEFEALINMGIAKLEADDIAGQTDVIPEIIPLNEEPSFTEKGWEKHMEKNKSEPVMTADQEQNLKEAKYQEGWKKYKEGLPEEEPLNLDFGQIFKPVSTSKIDTSILEKVKIMEAALDTIDYLGWLKGKKIEAKLDSDNFLSEFYKSRHDRFVKENTP